jgi:hypothetical protein
MSIILTWLLTTFGKVAVDFALGLIREALARKDFSDKIKLEIANETLTLANVALAWKAEAAARPDGGGDLRVQPNGGQVPLPGANPPPHDGPE